VDLILLFFCIFIFKEIRVKMREMGAATTAEIEPEQQTALLDACISLPGVIGGGVPGGTSML
jgi:phosphomevalonate kinase